MNVVSTKSDLKKQIQRMVAFIHDEAKEKVEEIDMKSEGEFCFEKGRILKIARQEERRLIEKKQNRLSKKHTIDISSLRNKARIRLLAATDAHVNDMAAEVQSQVLKHLSDKSVYKNFLQKLTVQGLCMILEPEVLLRVRKEDHSLMKGMLDKIAKHYGDLSRTTVKLVVLEDFLPAWTLGGVELISTDSTIMIQNTVHSRLELIIEMSLPLIREGLFGYVPRSTLVQDRPKLSYA